MNTGPGRTVVRHADFEAEAALIDPSVRRMDEALRYVEHLLARHPDAGIPTSTPGVRVAPINLPLSSIHQVKPASVFYTHDDERVHLLSIKLDRG